MLEEYVLYESLVSSFLALSHSNNNPPGDVSIQRANFVAAEIYELTRDLVMASTGYFFVMYKEDSAYLQDINSLLESLDLALGDEFNSLLHTLVKSEELDNLLLHNSQEKASLESAISKKIIANMDNIGALIVELVYCLSLFEIRDDSLSTQTYRTLADRLLYIYSPIANRLGLWALKWQLEDLYLKENHNQIYKKIAHLLSETRVSREEYTTRAIDEIEHTLRSNGFEDQEIDVQGRSKGIYSTYMKMKQLYCYDQNLDFSKVSLEDFQKDIEDHFAYWFNSVHDLIGLRVLCNSSSLCYEAFSVITNKFPPYSTFRRPNGELVDYIASPKSNGYQSLHVVVLGLDKKAIEVQIRTYEMHKQAEYGVAAHWKYKESGKSVKASSKDYGITELKRIISQKGIASAQKIFNDLKPLHTDLSKVYAFTPNGDVKTLKVRRNQELDKVYYPTPIDFAYYIHTDIGHRCIRAKVNGKIAPLDTPLNNGDIVEVSTQKKEAPRLEWLNFVSTPKASNRILSWHKQNEREENFSHGKSLLEKELGKPKLEEWLRSNTINAVAIKCNYPDVRYMLAELGYGSIKTEKIIHVYNQLLEEERAKDTTGLTDENDYNELEESFGEAKSAEKRQPKTSNSRILGVEGLLHYFAHCCDPIPGEEIVGVVSRTKGIGVHWKKCRNIEQVEPNKIIPIRWNPETVLSGVENSYLVDIEVFTIQNRPGLLKNVLSHISDEDINVEWASVNTKDHQAHIKLSIRVESLQKLNRIFLKIRQMSEVKEVKDLRPGRS